MTATNYAVAPGEYLEEWGIERGVSHQRVAILLGWSRERLIEFGEGLVPVTDDIANRLENVTGVPADSWLRYEATYRADLARIYTEPTEAIKSLAAVPTDTEGN